MYLILSQLLSTLPKFYLLYKSLIWQKNRIVYERQRQKLGFGALKLLCFAAINLP
jgi:hypothetical protein